jgi:glycerol transport system ATP-binding protein
MAEITLKALSHSYVDPPEYVLHDVELRWRAGGAYALLGPSGCGKTTLLNIISGLIRPSKGRVLYGERDVTDLPTRQRNIAQVFQFPVVYDTMSVFDNLAFPLRNRGKTASEIKSRVEHIASMLELSTVLGLRATQLTADQKQIISLGRGLVRDDVAAILFDEPLTVIDPHRKWVLRRKLREIHREFQHTLIYVTHDQTEALTFADEVVVMHQGRVLQQGTPQELFFRPAHTYVGYFIGSPGMNFLPCQIDDADQDHARVAGHRVALPHPLVRALGALQKPGNEGGALELGIRPEHVALATPESKDSLPVRVDHVEDHGRFHIASARLDALPLKIKLHDEVRAGQDLRISLPPARLCLYRNSQLVAAAAEDAA